MGKALAALFLGNHQPEEAILANELPDLVGQVVLFVGDFPVIQHAAKLLDRPVEERLFFAGEVGRFGIEQFRPLGLPGEKLAIPVYGA